MESIRLAQRKGKEILSKGSILFHPFRWFLIIMILLLTFFRLFDKLHRGFGEEVWSWKSRSDSLFIFAVTAAVFLFVEAIRAGVFKAGGDEVKDYMERGIFAVAVDLCLLIIIFVVLLFKLPVNY